MKEIWTLIRTWFWTDLKPLLLRVATQVSKKTFEVACQLVQQAATDPALAHSGDAKRQFVYNGLKDYAVQSGNPLADSVINLIIELAVNKLK